MLFTLTVRSRIPSTDEVGAHLLIPMIYFTIYLQIPNPLFDLAGITCGHFLVPFWTFFGATLIGKAVIKMSIQVGEKHFKATLFKSK